MKEESIICYIATHKESGKCYIGITRNKLSDRKADHESHANVGSHKSRFHDAIREYGKDAFSWKVIAEGSDVAMQALERILVYEWETFDPDKGFNKDGGYEAQIRYQMRKSKWKIYGPPWMNEYEVPLMEMGSLPGRDKEVALLDLMNDINCIVSYLEKTPLDGHRCDDLRGFVERLQKRIDQEDPSV